MAHTELDYMEYANSALAQTAYATSGTYSSDVLTGGTASADSEQAPDYLAAKACDDNDATLWGTIEGSFPHWWKYDLGEGVTKQVSKLRIKAFVGGIDADVKNFKLQGSNDDSEWTDIHTDIQANNLDWQDYTFSNNTAYRYYRIYVIDQWQAENLNCAIFEIEMMEMALECYSESSIKEQGDYSLKGIAILTTSLNETLTRTVGPTVDLSGLDNEHLHLYALRTGAHIKVGIHDAGGVTTEITPTIASSDTWEEFRLDLSGVADADKDAIDSIIITIVNADAGNTFYIDNLFGGPFAQALADTLALTDSLAKKTKKPLADTIYFTDTITKKAKKVLSDTIYLTDSISKQIKRAFTDTIYLTDAIAKKTIKAAMTDTLDLTDAITKKAKKVLSDTIYLTDATIIKKIKKVLTDTIYLTDKLRMWFLKHRPTGSHTEKGRPSGDYTEKQRPKD